MLFLHTGKIALTKTSLKKYLNFYKLYILKIINSINSNAWNFKTNLKIIWIEFIHKFIKSY